MEDFTLGDPITTDDAAGKGVFKALSLVLKREVIVSITTSDDHQVIGAELKKTFYQSRIIHRENFQVLDLVLEKLRNRPYRLIIAMDKYLTDEVRATIAKEANAKSYNEAKGSDSVSEVLENTEYGVETSRVWSPRFGQSVIKKVLTVSDTRSASLALREIFFQARIEHSNICKALGLEFERPIHEPYKITLYQEEMKTDLLKDIVNRQRRDQPYTEEELRRVLEDVCAGLAHAKAKVNDMQGIAQRDIKPLNIFMDQRQGYQVGNFGFAWEKKFGSVTTGWQATLMYMSPEARATMTKSRPNYDLFMSDVFSLGVTLLHLSMLTPPDRLQVAEQGVTAISHELINKLRYTESFKTLLKSMLAVTPETRPTLKDVLKTGVSQDGDAVVIGKGVARTGEREYKVSRFGDMSTKRWGVKNDENQIEAVSFTVSKSIFLTAVGIGTSFVKGESMKVKELSIVAGPRTNGAIIATTSGMQISDIDGTKVSKLGFQSLVEIAENRLYTMRLATFGEAGLCRGSKAQTSLSGPKHVAFTFQAADYDDADIKNGDNLTDGPIIELYYKVNFKEGQFATASRPVQLAEGEDSEYRISRFSGVGNRWGIYTDGKNQVEAVSFSVSKPIFLTAVSVGSSFAEGKTVLVQELSIVLGTRTDGRKVTAEAGIVIPYDSSSKTFKIKFGTAIEITPQEDYTLRLLLRGEAGVFRGTKAQTSVTGSRDVEFTFKTANFADEDIKNGDNLTDGPIFDFYYRLNKEGLALASAPPEVEEAVDIQAEHQISRFASMGSRWGIYLDKNQVEAVSFIASKSIFLTAIGVGAAYTQGQTVTVKKLAVILGKNTDGKPIATETGIAVSNNGDPSKSWKISLTNPVEISPQQDYTLYMAATGEAGFFRGDESKQLVTGPGRVEFLFQAADYADEDIKNGDNLTSGPLIQLYYKLNPEKLDMKGAIFIRFSDLGSSWHINDDGKQVEAITFKPSFAGLLLAVGVANAYGEGNQTTIRTLEVRKGEGTGGEVVYTHGQPLPLQRKGDSDAFVKVPFMNPLAVASEFYTLRVMYEPDSRIMRGTKPSNPITKDGLTITFQKATFENEDVENGSQETHGPLRDFYFLAR